MATLGTVSLPPRTPFVLTADGMGIRGPVLLNRLTYILIRQRRRRRLFYMGRHLPGNPNIIIARYALFVLFSQTIRM